MIPNSLVQQANEVALYDVISLYVDLKKDGTGYTGLSPFKNERTPSFKVSESKRIWKCFATGESGKSPIDFLMKSEKMKFTEAVKTVCQIANIPFKEVRNSVMEKAYKKRKAITDVLRDVCVTYQENLLNSPNVVTYLKNRGVSKEIALKFRLGYSIDSYNELIGLSKTKNWSLNNLEQAGLIKLSKRSYYDSFRGRLMFPIINHNGDFVGFGGRILDDTIQAPKYLNSVDTEVYNKSEVLYGLNFSKKSIQKRNFAYITEGYMDVIKFSMYGAENVVGVCGTAITNKHLALLKRYTHRLIFVFDGDNAGIKATLKAVDLALAMNFQVRVIKLKGIDPDDLATQKKFELNSYLAKNALDFVDYKASFINENNIDAKTKIISSIIRSISLIPDEIKRSLLTQQVKKRFELNDVNLDVKVSSKRKKIIKKKDVVIHSSNFGNLIILRNENRNILIRGQPIDDYIIENFQELEDVYINFDYSKLLLNKPSEYKEVKHENEVKNQIDNIFQNIKLTYVVNTINKCTVKDILFIQDLLHIKSLLISNKSKGR